jgi:hypothetical protein
MRLRGELPRGRLKAESPAEGTDGLGKGFDLGLLLLDGLDKHPRVVNRHV